jgi:hypothetical protein
VLRDLSGHKIEEVPAFMELALHLEQQQENKEGKYFGMVMKFFR